MRHLCVLLVSAIAFSCFALAGCDKPAVGSPPPPQLQENPLSMKIDLPKQLTASLEGWGLRLEAVTFQGRHHTGLRVFVNNPSATAETPTSSDTYLGSISPGHYDKNFVSTGDFVIDLGTITEPAKKLLLSASTVEITCVPLLRDEKSNVSVTVGKIRVDHLKSSR